MLAVRSILACLLLVSSSAHSIVDDLTKEEKYNLVNGVGFKTRIQQDGYYVGNVLGVPRLSIPSIKMQDAAQGFRTTDMRQVGEVTSWPCSLAVASAWDPDLMETWAEALGEEHRAKGANVILGPSMNVHRVQKGGRNAEYISGESPALGAPLSSAYVRGVQSKGVMAVAKHFALNNQETNRNTVNSVASERTMMEVYFPPFQAAIDAGVASFMCSYNLVNGTHSCGNEDLLRRDLKDRMGFSGFVMSDWWAVNDVDYPNSGLDMDMPGDDGFFDFDNLDALNDGVVDEMVTRIVDALTDVGLMGKDGEDAAFPSLCEIPDDCDGLYYNSTATSDAHVALARKIGGEGAVLLKNDNNLLPFDGGGLKKIAVVGSACDPGNDIERMLKIWNLGNYFTMGGSGRVIGKDPVSVLAGILEVGDEMGFEVIPSTTDSVDDAKAATIDADVVVVCGATTSTEGQDRNDLYVDQDEFITEFLEDLNVPSVVVTITPGATVLSNFVNNADAAVNVFLLGEETGHAIADVLFGVVNPSGKLPVTFPLDADDATAPCKVAVKDCVYEEGVLVGYRGLQDKDVGFSFGHGLSFSTFEYDWAREFGREGGEVRITNTGGVEGREVVQLYMNGGGEGYELKKYVKTPVLKGGESVVVQFKLGDRDFSRWDSMKGNWDILEGLWTIGVGGGSRDIRLTREIEIRK